TKNNMQIISSMLKMQSRSIENRSLAGDSNIDFLHDSFNDVINKIKAMSLVHQKLYQAEDLSHINLKEYVKDLVNLLMISYGIRSESLSLKLDLKDVFVLIDSAIPLGLVLNELISNTFKHAFPNAENDEIFIRLFQDKDGTINIQLNDNGVGIPSDINLENVNTMGLQTVFNLIKYQLKGEITYNSDKGLKWNIKLKDNLHKERV
ncbi:MAG: sensor histidine kinase, partial [FCB group bacterium]|nr:sensor histidine kinase [FCB group bacterium]